jgi:hypothetical protein
MKKLLAITLALVLALSLAACGGSGGDGGSNTGSVTLASMKKAVTDKGYKTEDTYQDYSGNGVAGFSVEFSGILLSIIEFKTAADASAYAKTIDDAGYSKSIVNGKYLSFASVKDGVVEDPAVQTFLENLLNGKDLESSQQSN